MIVEDAMAAAARQAGYPGLATVILAEHLTPQGVAALFRAFSVASDRGKTLAMILATAAIAGHRANPAAGWDREAEEAIIKRALAEPPVLLRGKLGAYDQDTTRAFQKVAAEAAQIVAGFFP
jgi:hypothetical protein